MKIEINNIKRREIGYDESTKLLLIKKRNRKEGFCRKQKTNFVKKYFKI